MSQYKAHHLDHTYESVRPKQAAKREEYTTENPKNMVYRSVKRQTASKKKLYIYI